MLFRSGADNIDGGTGNNTASYVGSAAAVTVNLTTGVNTGGDAAGDILTNIQNLTGSANADALTGNTSANIFIGGAGADVLTGGAGADDFVYLAVANSAASVAANTTVTFDSITDFTAGTDNINIAAINTVLTGGAAATGVTVTTLTTAAGSLADTTIANFAELVVAVDNLGLTASAAGAAGAATGIQAYVINLTGNTGALGTGTYLLINNADAVMTAADVMIAWTGTSQAPVGGTDFILA